MKQIPELTASPTFTDTFSWSATIKPTRFSFTVLKQKAVEQISCHRCLLLSGAATLLISGLFLAGSYLFFIQLAKYGW